MNQRFFIYCSLATCILPDKMMRSLLVEVEVQTAIVVCSDRLVLMRWAMLKNDKMVDCFGPFSSLDRI